MDLPRERMKTAASRNANLALNCGVLVTVKFRQESMVMSLPSKKLPSSIDFSEGFYCKKGNLE
jgi:hypothetical protein